MKKNQPKKAASGLVSFRISKSDANFISGLLGEYADNAREMDPEEIRVYFGTRANHKNQIVKASRLSKRFDRSPKRRK